MTDVSVAAAAAKGVSLDLADFDSLDEADMQVMHPDNGAPTNWVITFAGPGHKQTVEFSEKQARERLREDREKEQARVNGRKWKAQDESVAELREKNLNWIASRILRWTPVKINGEEYPFSKENAMKLLSDPRKGNLFQQCLDFLSADQSFTKRSGTI